MRKRCLKSWTLKIAGLQADFIGAKNYTINPTTNNVKKAKFSLPDVLQLLAETGIIIEE
jgi:hypothetical protein